MSQKTQKTLHRFFKKQAISWSMVGFILTVCFTLPSAAYIAKTASERQVLTVAKSAANAFRPLILDGHIRDAQFQMQKSLGLVAGESAVVRDPHLNAMYAIESDVHSWRCSDEKQVCWSKDYQYVHYLHPIYFDDDSKKELFGYLDVTLKPVVDKKVFGLIFFAICLAFIVQAIGLSSALVRSGRNLTAQLKDWAIHLQERPKDSLSPARELPFVEMQLLENAVSGLHFEIKRLEHNAATKGKAAGQLSILLELGHELKTPLSQLAKLFAVLAHVVRSTGKLDEALVGHIEGRLKRIGDVVRQVRTLNVGGTSEIEFCFLNKETRSFVSDLAYDPEVTQKSVKIQVAGSSTEDCAKVAPVALHRILENLVRNAVHAVDANGEIIIAVEEHNGRPMLSIKDNGSGIPQEIQDRIFDFDFTTKPSRGTGLGLGFVKKLCNQFNAELSFASEVGKGTIFQVIFQPHQMEC